MSIRARLSLSYLAILLLLGVNLVFYFWSDAKRQASFEELRSAIERQNLIGGIRQELDNCTKQVTLLSQMMTGAAGAGPTQAERTRFNSRLHAIGDRIHRVSLLEEGRNRTSIETFGIAFQELSRSWRTFYANIGYNQAVAIEEVALRAEPLSDRVIHQLLPQLEQNEKETIEADSAHFYGSARATKRFTIIIFAISGLLTGLLAWRVARHFLTGIGALRAGADDIGAGNLTQRILVKGGDELSDLADSFNDMAVHLRLARSELEKRQREMSILKDAAESANRAKSQFLANMSHELRTPMNAIIGYSEILAEDAQDLALDGFVSDLHKIRGAGHHLLSLINDILDISKIEAGKADLFLETFEIGPMMRDVAGTVQPLIDKNSNRLDIEIPPDLGSMRADLTKVRQSLFNLLSNAGKFTARGAIRFSVMRRVIAAREWIEFRVADSGIGMTGDQLSRVFDAFAQADASTTRRFGGTGLGLTITKEFCEMMGGAVAVKSEPGEGTAFTITLPADVESTGQAIRPPNQPAPGRPAGTPAPGNEGLHGHVLVIDDDPVIHDLLKAFLNKEGYDASVAKSGEDGLRVARDLHPDVITLDVSMPGMDGWAVLSALKSDEELADIPVIMLTMIDDRSAGYALGAAEYLTKPVDRMRLGAVLHKYGRLRHRSVLVVDDDTDTRNLLKSALQKDGWKVQLAENGRVALKHITSAAATLALPGLVLLDLMMPELDGLAFLEIFRRIPNARDIPVIVLTAKDLDADERRLLNGCVQKVMQKGMSTDLVLREVRDLLALSLGAGQADVSADDSKTPPARGLRVN